MLKPIDFGKVADIYDTYVRADHDIPFWIEEAGRTGGRILELTSGTGRVSLPLLEAGIDLTCVDYCPEMLTVLKSKTERAGLSCTVVEMDIIELSLPIQYDLIFIPSNSFSEIIDRKNEKTALTRIRAHLAENGVFICTLQNPAVRRSDLYEKNGVIGKFETADGGTLTVSSQLEHDEKSGIVHGFQFYEFHDENGRAVGKRSLEVNFRLIEREEFENLAGSAGFEVTDMYGDYDYAKFSGEKSPYMIWRMKSVEH